jgi:fumarylacetoacetase
MRQENTAPHRLGLCNAKNLYWTVAQMLAHHASNGCNIRPGDIMASGTLSGPGGDALGCMLELTKRGSEPAKLGNGEERRFLEDGDEIIMRGRCERAGQVGIGFGEVRGTVLPAA